MNLSPILKGIPREKGTWECQSSITPRLAHPSTPMDIFSHASSLVCGPNFYWALWLESHISLPMGVALSLEWFKPLDRSCLEHEIWSITCTRGGPCNMSPFDHSKLAPHWLNHTDGSMRWSFPHYSMFVALIHTFSLFLPQSWTVHWMGHTMISRVRKIKSYNPEGSNVRLK